MISSFFLSTFGTFGKQLFEKSRLRRTAYFLSLTSIIFAIITYTYVVIKRKEDLEFYLDKILPFFLIIPGIFLLSYLMFLASKYKGTLAVELEKLHVERDELTTKIEVEKDRQIFRTIQLSLNQLTEYYSINKAQAKSSFGFSIFAIILGLMTIIAGIWFFYLKVNPDINLTILTGIAGLLLEFIGGAYFFMYKKSLEQVNFFFGQLIKIQDTMLSIDLSKNIGSKEKEIELTEKIITSLLERSLK